MYNRHTKIRQFLTKDFFNVFKVKNLQKIYVKAIEKPHINFETFEYKQILSEKFFKIFFQMHLPMNYLTVCSLFANP